MSAVYYTATSTTAGTYIPSQWVTISGATISATTAISNVYSDDSWPTVYGAKDRTLQCGQEYVLPDGSKLLIDEKGNYVIDDKDATVTYRANRVREFNRFINASDLLESFIREVGRMDGVRQDEVMRLPIEAFINWIILGAAKQDGDDTSRLPTVQAALPAPIRADKPRCGCCGRFIRNSWAAARIAFCSPQHMAIRLAELA